jgi:maltose O-acetyltransferase
VSRFKQYLFRDQVRMRTFNQSYVYLIHLTQSFLNLMPPPLRNLGFRLLLKRMGRHTFIDYNVYIKFPWLVEIGEHVSINRGVQFFSGFKERYRVIIGNHVYIAPDVGFFAAGHDIRDLSQHVGGDIVVSDNVWIGARAILLPGVTIGENSIVGAGSVVTQDVPANRIAVGNPARVIREREPSERMNTDMD